MLWLVMVDPMAYITCGSLTNGGLVMLLWWLNTQQSMPFFCLHFCPSDAKYVNGLILVENENALWEPEFAIEFLSQHRISQLTVLIKEQSSPLSSSYTDGTFTTFDNDFNSTHSVVYIRQ